jgi:hypothetical protein
MAQLTVNNADSNGLTPTFVSASAGGDSFVNDGQTLLRIKNAGGSPVTLTVVAQSFSNHKTKVNQTVTVPATTGDMIVGFFDPSRFNDQNGQVQLTYSAVTSVTVVPISVAKY